MSEIIYWAIKLTDKSRAQLLSNFPPKHSKIYAEHITLAFGPTKQENDALSKWLGKSVKFKVITTMSDNKGQAVGVLSEPDRLDGKLGHITISCTPDTKPVYSNVLMEKAKDEFCTISPFELEGVVAKYTKRGWEF